MEIIFLISLGIVIFYSWAELRKHKDRIIKNRKKRAKKWSKKSNKEKYGRWYKDRLVF